MSKASFRYDLATPVQSDMLEGFDVLGLTASYGRLVKRP